MNRQRFLRLFSFLAAALVLGTAAAAAGAQQTAPTAPELSVAGIRLGSRASGREFLAKYTPTTDERGRAVYYFYNNLATQVMKVTVASFDDPHFVTEIEVFAVGQSYRTPHFVAEKISHFMTEERIFIGLQQSVASMLLVPGVSRGDMIGPKDVAKKKGAPHERLRLEDGREAYEYKFGSLAVPDENAAERRYDYTARYEFRKSKLKRFRLAIAPANERRL